ncbi:MAG: domain containing protein [Chitinophagaceae bacterium]|nr:domain containing protein [Chitinophagaceae bacterium]
MYSMCAKRLSVLVWLFCFLTTSKINSQVCSIVGQTPKTAFPVCGIKTFQQGTVPLCSGPNIPSSCPASSGTLSAKNPYWYKFTCYVPGSLALLITPLASNEDYDWQLFDVTGHDPNDVFTDQSLFVVANWAGTYGATGTSATATSNMQCGSDPATGVTTFSSMPMLIQGHDYLLLISHFTAGQSGYTLQFNGGNAIIYDTTQPRLKNLTSSCTGGAFTLTLNKKLTCSSVTPSGSEFNINLPTGTTISNVQTVGCNNGFDMDSIILSFSKPLPAGDYILKIQNGSDGNTIVDNCNTGIPVGDSITIHIDPALPTTIDKLEPVGCAPASLRLSFKNLVNSNTIAADGTDFSITGGPSNVNIISATPLTPSGTTTTVVINLSAPIYTQGNWQLNLKTGSDGNTIIDACNNPIAPASVNFTTVDTVSAKFSYQVINGCKMGTVNFSYTPVHATSWLWTFDDNTTSKILQPVKTFTTYGSKTEQLVVSNGTCKDTSKVDILLVDNTLHAAFTVSANPLCPEDLLSFTNATTGNITEWLWRFGNGNSSTIKNPSPESYNISSTAKDYVISLAVKNNIGCIDTTSVLLKVLSSCYIAVPSAFTPNGDGLNDFLYPLNAIKATNLLFRVYSRTGQVIFETHDWTKKWDGKLNGKLVPSGTYVWTLSYTHIDTGKPFFLKGTSVLIR